MAGSRNYKMKLEPWERLVREVGRQTKKEGFMRICVRTASTAWKGDGSKTFASFCGFQVIVWSAPKKSSLWWWTEPETYPLVPGIKPGLYSLSNCFCFEYIQLHSQNKQTNKPKWGNG